MKFGPFRCHKTASHSTARAIQAADFPPDLVENGTSLWTLNRSQMWELAECLYVRKLGPDYSKQFPGLAAFADYNYLTRPESVRKNIHCTATESVRKAGRQDRRQSSSD